MAVFSDRETQLALRAVLNAVAGLPPAQHRWWDNSTYKPTPGVPYLSERYSSGPSFIRALGTVEHRGLYLVTIFGNPGLDITPIRTITDAILAAFPAMKGFAMASGNVVRVRGDQSPYASEIIPLIDTSFSYSQVTVPWLVLATRPS